MSEQQRENLIAVWSSHDTGRVREFLVTLQRDELIAAVLLLHSHIRTDRGDEKSS